MAISTKVGAIDGTHIPFSRHQERPSDYTNRNGYFSILMQASIYFRLLFYGH